MPAPLMCSFSLPSTFASLQSLQQQSRSGAGQLVSCEQLNQPVDHATGMAQMFLTFVCMFDKNFSRPCETKEHAVVQLLAKKGW